MYLHEIGHVDLLTADDERRLAQLIEDGHLAAGPHRRGGRAASSPDAEIRRLMRACSAASGPRAS